MTLSLIKKTGLVLLAMASLLSATVHAAGSNLNSSTGTELVAISDSERLALLQALLQARVNAKLQAHSQAHSQASSQAVSQAGTRELNPKLFHQRSSASHVTVVNVRGAVAGKVVSSVAWQLVSGVATQRVLVEHGRHGYKPVWFTVQRGWLATGWDIRALQIELERLGIKVKPKPAVTKPSSRQTG